MQFQYRRIDTIIASLMIWISKPPIKHWGPLETRPNSNLVFSAEINLPISIWSSTTRKSSLTFAISSSISPVALRFKYSWDTLETLSTPSDAIVYCSTVVVHYLRTSTIPYGSRFNYWSVSRGCVLVSIHSRGEQTYIYCCTSLFWR